ncbi:UDP-N-acetylglucosamine 2-epimerase [Thioalkalivibrio sp. ALMg9]|uniref:UDP-N-acetylglucosamine 2-epimerase n=1 Tax=Thioalkalivibrio sp. ALMg9 TaxID=1266912 RepID=UPI00035C4A62|nr:UDP-N-acetylglucosamine 2-epimerase [Thioalkalivibrio sp. ALMg9]
MPEPPTDSPRLVAILGTRAQTIKMAPLLGELEHQGLPYRLLLTGQHRETIDELLDEFGIRTSREWLYEGPEVKGMAQAANWMFRTAWTLWRSRNDWAARPRRKTIVLTHGDTFTTLLAASVGWLVRARVAHVEAGLRSYDWRHPFPEELTRLIVTRFAKIAYCPGEWACGNLNTRRQTIVDTGANTILDALRTVTSAPARPEAQIYTPYVVVSVHRFENLYSRERLDIILDTVQHLAERLRVVLVLHPTTRKRLTELGELEALEQNPKIELRPRMTYVPFMQMIGHAKLVITDGGSNQEELSYLGIPTLLMRMATERQEGLDDNVILSRFDPELIRETIQQAITADTATPQSQLPASRPAAAIARDIGERLEQSIDSHE